MVPRVQVLHKDDLDGGPADETLTLGLDGRDKEIDLSADNAEQLREALRPFVGAARQATSDGPNTRTIRPAHGDAAETAAIRPWAKKHSRQVSGRVRIPAEIRQAYHAVACGQPKGSHLTIATDSRGMIAPSTHHMSCSAKKHPAA